jgi:hypothetical protein
MKIPGLCVCVLALIFLGNESAANAQSIASVGGISTTETVAERRELEELWKLALARSPDMQFAIQRLNGNRDRLLSTILWEAEECLAGPQLLGMTPRAAIVGIFRFNSPSVENTKTAAISASASAPLTEDQATMLQSIRNAAERLVSCYRDYVRLSRAFLNADGKVECKVKAPPEHADPVGQPEWDYEVTRVQREIDHLVDDLKRARSALTEMVGSNAVRQLDEKLIGPDTIRQTDEKHRLRKFDKQFLDPIHHAAGTG